MFNIETILAKINRALTPHGDITLTSSLLTESLPDLHKRFKNILSRGEILYLYLESLRAQEDTTTREKIKKAPSTSRIEPSDLALAIRQAVGPLTLQRYVNATDVGAKKLLRYIKEHPDAFVDDVGIEPWPISSMLRSQIEKNRLHQHNLRSGSDPVYNKAFKKRQFWSNDQKSEGNKILSDQRVNPFANSVSELARKYHERLHSASVASGAVRKLTQAERDIINLYSKESLPFHTITLGFRDLNAQEKAQGYHMGQGVELINALSRLPSHKGKTYRGAFIEKGFTYETSGVPVTRSMTVTTGKDGKRRAWKPGDYVTTRTFFSTSAAKGVAAEFIMRQRFGSGFHSDTAILNVAGTSGRNITQLTHIKQAEVLYPAYTVFQVKHVQKGEFGLEIDLEEVDEEIWNDPDAVIRDYRFGNVVLERPKHMIPQRTK
ncbi:NAD:arginine ADP-ribosyltransferase [Enterobacter sp. AG5470]|nr:NAD:arginine ADP-ribosyltransferase [Enterobacter sp. AG5470]